MWPKDPGQNKRIGGLRRGEWCESMGAWMSGQSERG